MMSQETTVQKLLDLLEPVAVQHGYELVDVDLTTEHGQRVVRVFIDRDGHVGIDDCAKLSAYLEDILDMSDVLHGSYVFEVSSPGLNRPLRTPAHFNKAVGQKIRIVTREKLEGRQNYKGTLKSVAPDTVTLEIDDRDFILPFDKIQKAHVVHSF